MNEMVKKLTRNILSNHPETEARIEHGMNTVLGGDAAYGGQFTKNPHHQDHLTQALALLQQSVHRHIDVEVRKRNVVMSEFGDEVEALYS